MSEHHHHHHDVSGKNLLITIVLNIIITISQIIGGILSGSLALLSDALHNFSDVLSLVIAYVANRLAARRNTEEKTFGYKRAEILAAFFNASILIGIGLFLITEAFHKFYHPEVINSIWVITLGMLSIVLNALSVFLIKDDAHDNINIKAAYLHLLTDVMTSVAVVAGGLLIYYFNLFWIDPLVSLLIAFYLIWASIGLVKEAFSILMQFTPTDIKIEDVIKAIKSIEEIEDVHHIHIWKLNDKSTHLEAHLDYKNNLLLEQTGKILDNLEALLYHKFKITHTTFQCEYKRNDNKNIINN
ncbi:cation diffusion facilitator family transporter [Sulfurimonas sp.]